MEKKKVIIVGAGFAGVACAYHLVKLSDQVHVTLIDKNDYTQFKPLLYQVATCALSTDEVATNLRTFFEDHPNIEIKMAEIDSIHTTTHTVATKEGQTYQGDFLVLSTGSVVNFFDTKGANTIAYPLYTLQDAENLRSRLLEALENGDRDSSSIKNGMLNFVIIGGGPTGVELAGALADLLSQVLPKEYSPSLIKNVQIYIIDGSPTLLGAFSKESQEYASKILSERGVKIITHTLVKEIQNNQVILSNGETLPTCTVIWAGGLKASTPTSAGAIPTGHGNRIEVNQDLTVPGYNTLYALGDCANIPGPNQTTLPQLASVAQQSGKWAAKNITATILGKERMPFEYDDKGIMAMIGKDAAVAEIGKKRHQLEGTIAFAAWLGVHAALLYTVRQRVEAFIEWAWDYFGNRRSMQVIDRKK